MTGCVSFPNSAGDPMDLLSCRAAKGWLQRCAGTLLRSVRGANSDAPSRASPRPTATLGNVALAEMKTMQLHWGQLAALLLLAAGSTTRSATTISAKVIDPLGRPVANATVDVHWLKSIAAKDVRRVGLVKLMSDRNGIVKGTYDETS